MNKSQSILLSLVVVAVGLAGCAPRSQQAGTEAGSNAAKEAVVRRYVELINAHQFNQLHEVFAADFKLHLGSDSLDGAQVAGLTAEVLKSFPDFKHTVDDLFSNGDRVVLRLTDHGTHQGEFQGIAATGRKIEIGQISIYRVVDGKIAEAWEQADLAGLLAQLQSAEPASDAAPTPAR